MKAYANCKGFIHDRLIEEGTVFEVPEDFVWPSRIQKPADGGAPWCVPYSTRKAALAAQEDGPAGPVLGQKKKGRPPSANSVLE